MTTREKKPLLALWVPEYVQADRAFEREGPHNANGFYLWAAELRALLRTKGWDCHTQDVCHARGEIPTTVLLPEIPRVSSKILLGTWYGQCRPMVALWEAPVVTPRNWDIARHSAFDTLFTWDPRLIDGKRYRPLPAAPREFDGAFKVERNLSNKTGLCVLVATNQRRGNPQELYSERLKAIRWFEMHHPESFDLYGRGWSELGIRGHARLRKLGLMGLLTQFFPPEKRPSYRGSVADKLPLMQRYRFSICYENVREIPGYITEKIFDSFQASCVPVYLGAPDIAQHVPEGCFIDYNQFGTYERLHAFLTAMTDAEYLGYLDRIEAFSTGFAARSIADAVTGH
jgi:hypothetical protein